METYMKEALLEARKAYELGEVPIGCVIVKDGIIIGRGYNQKETTQDPTSHAEMVAIRNASKHLQAWRLTDAEVYVTIEPCVMCMGALIQSRVSKLIYGARDPKFGGARSLYELAEDTRHNHRFEVIEGVLEEECASIMKEFFRMRRRENKERCPSG